MKEKNILIVIPARGGSKGIPHKNIKLLAGKPLIYYSIDVARQITSDKNICVSTDDEVIVSTVEALGLKVPFRRPKHLASDTATTNDVLIHAINFYESQGCKYDILLLLQPTSPFRKTEQVKEALNIFNNETDCDMLVSVKLSHLASVLCKEGQDGFLEFCHNNTGQRRQEFGDFYEYNGAIYIINIEALKEKGLSNLSKRKKYCMDDATSLDIDTPMDWMIAECMIKTKEDVCDLTQNNKPQ